MFNTLKYVKQLEEAGLTRVQAEAQIEFMTDVIESNLATRQDMKGLSTAMAQGFKDARLYTDRKVDGLRAHMDREFVAVRMEIRELRAETKNALAQLENRMTIKLGTIVSISLGVAVALARLI